MMPNTIVVGTKANKEASNGMLSHSVRMHSGRGGGGGDRGRGAGFAEDETRSSMMLATISY